MMKNYLHTAAVAAIGILAVAGCQRPTTTAPPSSSFAPPTLTSSPLPPPEKPRPHDDESMRVYRYDFVLTSKDPKESPTSFSLNLREHSTGEVMVGKNIPIQMTGGIPLPWGKESAKGTTPPLFLHSPPRTDVGLKVKAQARTMPGTDDLLLDVDLELSSVEPDDASITTLRKVTSHGNAVATPGKSTLVMSLDDDKRHLELTVTPTKLK